MPYTSLGLSPALIRAARAQGHDRPTAIQAACIPAVLRGADVLASAPTGSGKTAAYALPVLQQLMQVPREAPRRTHALVLVPTRELAAQVGEVLRALAGRLAEPVRVASVFGGVSINPQMMALRGGADMVVATPGRLLDLLAHNALKLDRLSVLVLDEADRLIDAGFADETRRVIDALPARRQTLMFSATYPPGVQALAQALLHEPERIALGDERASGEQAIDAQASDDAANSAASPEPLIAQRAIVVDAKRRTALLHHLLQTEAWPRVLVFVATKYASEHLATKLHALGITAAAFHGDRSQGGRTHALQDFNASRLRVLVATDVAARGIDVAQLPAVVNFDLPRSPVDHTHRIGRTGRAGERGVAVSFISADVAGSETHFRLIEKRQRQRVPREQIAGYEPTLSAMPAPTTGGVKGPRKSKKDKLREAAAKAG